MAEDPSPTESLWDSQTPMMVTIRNMHSKIELGSLVYFFDGTLSHNVYANNVKLKTRESIEIRIDPDCLVSTGALMYRLTGGRILSSSLYMIIAWKLEYLKKPLVYILLVEHAPNVIQWNPDILREYYDRFSSRFRLHANKATQSWLLQDGGSLDVVLDAPNQRNYELSIIINDGENSRNRTQSAWIDQPIWVEPKSQMHKIPLDANVRSEAIPFALDSCVQFDISNHHDINLIGGTCNAFNGQISGGFLPTLRPGDKMVTTIRSLNPGVEVARGCIVYELSIKDKNIPIKRGYRVFLAIESFAASGSGQKHTAACLFMVKNRRFSGERDEVEWLHKDILQYHMQAGDHTPKWRLGELKLALEIKLLKVEATHDTREQHSKVTVVVKKDENAKYCKDPFFHRTTRFATPSDEIVKLIYAATNLRVAMANAKIQVLENRLQAGEGDVSVPSIECTFPEIYDEEHMVKQPFKSIRRLHSGEFHVYHKDRSGDVLSQAEVRRRANRHASDENEGEEIEDQFDHSVYCIALQKTNDDVRPVCILALKQGYFSCEAVLFYINLPSENVPEQAEAPLEEVVKQKINQLAKSLMDREDWSRKIKFAPGQLCEMPIYFTRREVACITIHQPLSKLSISSVILQNEFDPWGPSHSFSIKGLSAYKTRIMFINGLTKTNFKLDKYYSTDQPSSSVPERLVSGSNSSNNECVSFNMLYSKCYERHQFTFHYRYEDDDSIGFDIDVIVEPHWKDESPALTGVDIVTKASFIGQGSEGCWIQYKTKITHPSGQNDMQASSEKSETESNLSFNVNVKYSADVSEQLNFYATIEIQQK